MAPKTSSLDAVLDSLADHAVFRLDPDGVITSWNRVAEKTKGYTAPEILGQHFGVFYTLDDRAAGLPLKALQIARDTGRFQAEGWRVRKDGSRFWADVVIQPLTTSNGEFDGFVKVTRNIDDRLIMDKLREELQQSQKLELVGQLTGGIAHDFNNLLTAIESTFELIRQISKDERISRYLSVNRVAIDRSRNLIAQLLAFSRKQILHPRLLNVNDVVSVFHELLEKVAGERNKIVWHLDNDLPHVNIDGGHLQSALMNLVTNARDAMPNGGSVTIFSEVREIAADAFEPPFEVPAGTYLAIGVTDTGIGMTKDVAARCVEPFFTTKDIGKGTGLGLSQCFGFVRQSGGTIDIRSVAGAGTTIAILLPVDAPGALRDHAQRTILLVEDEPAVRELAAELLRTLGHTVVEASNAAEALAHLQHDRSIDLLLSDIMMPSGINGIELVVKARQMRPGLAAVLTSGYTQSTDLPEDTPFLSKPYTIHDLKESLHGHRPPLMIH